MTVHSKSSSSDPTPASTTFPSFTSRYSKYDAIEILSTAFYSRSFQKPTRCLSRQQQVLIRETTSLVKTISKRMEHRLINLSLRELESIGYEALIDAALRYNPSYKVPFERFVSYRIRGAMIDASRRETPGLRNALRAQAIMNDCKRRIENTRCNSLHRTRLEKRMNAARRVRDQAADSACRIKSNPKDPEKLGSQENSPEDRLLSNEEKIQLNDALINISTDDRTLLKQVYFNNRSLTEIAVVEGVTPSTISRRHQKALRRLKKLLDSGSFEQIHLLPNTK